MISEKPIPEFYVREETVAGPLYFWPRPAVKRDHSNYDPYGLVWFDADGNQAEQRGNYVITTQHTGELTARWPKPSTVDHYELKPAGTMTTVAKILAQDRIAYPSVLTRDEWKDRCEYQGDCGECSWCRVRADLYDRVMAEPSTEQATYLTEGLTELDIHEPDPDPELAWTLDSPSQAAFYPRPAHHQFPGALSGPFEEVAAQARKVLAEQGMQVDSFYEWTHMRPPTIAVTVVIVWDESLPYRKAEGRSKRVRELNAQRRRSSQVCVQWRGEVKVPQRVAGATKADALRRRRELVDELVAKLVPPHTVACSACRGRGYVQ